MISHVRLLVLGAVFVLASTSRAEDAPRPAVGRGEVRVYLSDAAGRPIAPRSEGRVYLELKGGGRRVLKLAPAGAASITSAVHEGGQLQRLRTGETLELVVLLPEEAVLSSVSRAHLAAPADLAEYSCPMKCAQDVKPGDCPKCGMEMTPSLLEFDAIVAVRFEDGWRNVKGFRFPQFVAPRTLREALERLVSLAAEIEALVENGKLDRVHDPALHVGAVGRALPRLATDASVEDPALRSLGFRLAQLGLELDAAADRGIARETARLLRELKSHVETFRAVVR